MRYVIKDKETGRFLRSSGEWTKFMNEAERFPNGLSVNLHLEAANLPRKNEMVVIRIAQ